MSERYGDCPACKGQGKIPDLKKPVEDLLAMVGLAFAIGGVLYEAKECGRCGGTGHNGDSLS